MTTPPAATGRPRTALELIADCITRLRMTDPTDTAAALLAAWHGFGSAEAAGRLLARDSPNDAVLARNAEPIFAAVAVHLRQAPSLPYTDQFIEHVDGLSPSGDRPTQTGDRSETTGPEPAASVRRGILALALELNTLLPNAIEHARVAADRTALQHATRLAHELGAVWQGRLGTFLNHSRHDLLALDRTATRRR